MLPVRPCSSLTAASSARMAGGEPSYPTTRYRFPAGGTVAFIEVKAIRFAGTASRYPAYGRHDVNDRTWLLWLWPTPARDDQGPTARSSERPASSRDHWAMGRPSGHADTGGQSGGPPLVRVWEHCWGQPGGESSHDSWRPYTVRSMSA